MTNRWMHWTILCCSVCFVCNESVAYNEILQQSSRSEIQSTIENSASQGQQSETKTTQEAAAKKQPVTGFFETGAQYFHLTDGYQNWSGEYLKGFFQTDINNNYLLELDHDQRFGQYGNYLVGEYTHTYNEDWYSNVGTGVSDNSTFVPKLYVGGAIFRKFGSKKQLIPYVGVHAYWWRPVSDITTQDVNPGVIYYFQSPWVVEGGMFFNRSNPGVVNTKSYYIAVTQGTDKKHFITLRYGFGREGYQGLLLHGSTVNAPIVNYPSQVATLTWRQWIGPNWGFNIVAEHYHNPFYTRYGGTVGIFGTLGILE